MKRIVNLFLTIVMVGCSADSAWDCVKTAGSIIEEEVPVDVFSEVEVHHRVQLFVQYGVEQQVRVETGQHLRNDIEVKVTDSILVIKNQASCNLFRDYGLTKVYVTSPDLKVIRNSSGLTVKGVGLLPYESLTLRSEDVFSEGVTHTNGDYELELDVDNFAIVGNGLANYYISGRAHQANIGLYAGDGRFEGRDFVVQDVRVFHRSSNKIIVNPQESLRGEIRSTGDLISVNLPPLVAVETYYTGQLIFE